MSWSYSTIDSTNTYIKFSDSDYVDYVTFVYHNGRQYTLDEYRELKAKKTNKEVHDLFHGLLT